MGRATKGSGYYVRTLTENSKTMANKGTDKALKVYNEETAKEHAESATRQKSPLVFSLTVCEQEGKEGEYIMFSANWIEKDVLIDYLSDALEALKKQHYIAELMKKN